MKSLALAGMSLAALLAGSAALQATTLVYCSEGSPESFSPALNTTGTSFDAARPVYNKLTEFERGSTKVVPGLAESWTVSDDGKVFTFKLKKGVKFHSVKPQGGVAFTPTRDLNVDDVLWSFNRQWKPEHPYAKVSGGKYDYFADMDMPKLLKSVDKVDKTNTGMVLGTPSYMSPEQLAGKKIDGRSDLFSLGVMLYQMSCGKLPFEGDSMAQLMFRIGNEAHPDIRRINPDLPDCVVDIIGKALTKDPDARYQTGAEFARDIRTCLSMSGGTPAADSGVDISF